MQFTFIIFDIHVDILLLHAKQAYLINARDTIDKFPNNRLCYIGTYLAKKRVTKQFFQQTLLRHTYKIVRTRSYVIK